MKPRVIFRRKPVCIIVLKLFFNVNVRLIELVIDLSNPGIDSRFTIVWSPRGGSLSYLV